MYVIIQNIKNDQIVLIKVTARHYPYIISASSGTRLFTQPFVQLQIKENIKDPL